MHTQHQAYATYMLYMLYECRKVFKNHLTSSKCNASWVIVSMMKTILPFASVGSKWLTCKFLQHNEIYAGSACLHITDIPSSEFCVTAESTAVCSYYYGLSLRAHHVPTVYVAAPAPGPSLQSCSVCHPGHSNDLPPLQARQQQIYANLICWWDSDALEGLTMHRKPISELRSITYEIISSYLPPETSSVDLGGWLHTDIVYLPTDSQWPKA